MRIKVFTFCDKGEARLSKIMAYTMWYPSASDGKEYEVEAKNGTEAKKIAKQLRLQDERRTILSSEDYDVKCLIKAYQDN